MLSVKENGTLFYSAKDIFKDIKENPGIVIAKGMKSYGIKENKDFIRKNSNYYVTLDSANKLLNLYAKTLDGMIAIRRLKEESFSTSKVDKISSSPKVSKPATEVPKDYGKRLVGISQYTISYHAKERIKSRFGMKTDKECKDWFTGLAPRIGFIGSEFGSNREVWGTSEATLIIDPQDKVVVTALDPDMDVNISGHDFPELDSQIGEALRKIKLNEERNYWEKLGSQYKELGNFAKLASESIEKTRKAKSTSGLDQMRDTVKSITLQYQYLTFHINELNAYHVEAMKYLKSKDPKNDEKRA